MNAQRNIIFYYLAWLFSAWSLYVGLIHPQIKTIPVFGSNLVELFRILIFILPLFYIGRKTGYPKAVVFKLHNDVVKNLLIGILAAFIFIAIALPLTQFMQGQRLGIEKISTTPVWAALTVAILVEEIVFRGYLLNAFIHFGKTKATLISTLLFLLIHFPGWILLNSHPTIASWITTSANIFVLGIILGYLYLKFNSLWTCIFVHSANNLVAAIVR